MRLSIPEAGVLTVYGKPDDGDRISPSAPETPKNLPAAQKPQASPELTDLEITKPVNSLPANSAAQKKSTDEVSKFQALADQSLSSWNVISAIMVGLIICAGLAAAFIWKSRLK